jgi:ATP synthase protein I
MGNTQAFHKARLAVVRLTGWQLGVTMALTAAALLVSRAAAASVFTGGAIGMLAGVYQSQRLLRVDASLQPASFMRGLWISEAVKIVLTVAMFIVAIRLLKVQMVPTMLGYIGTYIVYWAALGTAYPWFDTPVPTSNLRDRNWPDV